MPDQPYDKSSKWLLKHHAKSILRLAGREDVVSCETTSSEVIQPRKWPDGLLKVRFRDRKQPEYVVIEIATYPEDRAHEQACTDAMLTYLEMGQLPEMLTIVLCPKGNARVRGRLDLQSRLNWTKNRFEWKVVELWKLSAKDLLATNDPGLIPWVPLTKSRKKPETLLRECRERIEESGTLSQQSNLLAVTQVLAGLRYSDPALMALLGGSKAMLDSPVLRNLIASRRHQDIERFLLTRFPEIPLEITEPLKKIVSDEKLDRLVSLAGKCKSLEEFREALHTE